MTLVRVKLDDGTETSVGESFAESHNLKVLEDRPAADRRGRSLGPKYAVNLGAITAKGAELNGMLEAAGLATNGTLADRQQRLAEFQAAQAAAGNVPPGQEPGGDTPSGENGGDQS
jgi:hypothetical protein